MGWDVDGTMESLLCEGFVFFFFSDMRAGMEVMEFGVWLKRMCKVFLSFFSRR